MLLTLGDRSEVPMTPSSGSINLLVAQRTQRNILLTGSPGYYEKDMTQEQPDGRDV